jgi:hypothetical protein
MCSGSSIPDPDPELINAQNFDFAKPKLFFKNIGKYAATSTYIHVRIFFNFTTVFNPKQAIAGVYNQLLKSMRSLSNLLQNPSLTSLTSAWPLKDRWKTSATS